MEAHAGERVILTGTGLKKASGSLRGGSKVHELSLQVTENTASFAMPDLPPGSYILHLTLDEQQFNERLVMLGEIPEVPCARAYSVNTNVSLKKELAVIDRFFPDGRKERVETPFSMIERVEYSHTDACSAIIFRLKNGSALLYEDGPNPLKERAQTLASYLQRELVER